MTSIFDVLSLKPNDILESLDDPDISRSNYELMLDLIGQYNSNNILDTYGKSIVESDSFLIHTTESKDMLKDHLELLGLDPEILENLPPLLMVILLTVIESDNNNLWFYVIKELNDKLILSLVSSSVMNQELFELIYNYYKNTNLVQSLTDISDIYGFEIPYVSNLYSVFEQAIFSLPLQELVNIASINKEFNQLVVDNLGLLSEKYSVKPRAPSIKDLISRYRSNTEIELKIIYLLTNYSDFIPTLEDLKDINHDEFYDILYKAELDTRRYVNFILRKKAKLRIQNYTNIVNVCGNDGIGENIQIILASR